MVDESAERMAGRSAALLAGSMVGKSDVQLVGLMAVTKAAWRVE